MSLIAPFSTMSLPEVFGWLDSSRRAGVLTVRGVGVETVLHVRNGRVDECAASDPPAMLGQFLLFHGIITEDVLDHAMREHATGSRRLGDVLVDMGAVGGDTMTEALTAKAEETVLSTFDHPNGWFVFDPGATTVASPLALDMSIPDAIARGVRRAADAAVAAVSLERPGYVMRKTARTASPKLNSAWPLRSAYAAVDGERNIDAIVLHLHGAKFHVIQRLYQLLVEGFIELVAREETDPFAGDEVAESESAAPGITESTPREDLDHGISTGELQRVIPIALPREMARSAGDVSVVEKYLLTLCDGMRDVRMITAVASVRPHIVTDTIRSLIDRGLVRATMGAADRT